MDPSGKIPQPKSKSRTCRPSTAPAPRKASASANDLVPVVTKRRSAPKSRSWKLQQVFRKHEKNVTKTLLITGHLTEDKSLSTFVLEPFLTKKVRKRGSRKRAADADSEEDEELDPQDLSVSDEEREVVIRNGRRRLQQLLTETTSLVGELEKMEIDVERLQNEKAALLEELLSSGGLALNPYPPFRPLTRKVQLLRIRL